MVIFRHKWSPWEGDVNLQARFVGEGWWLRRAAQPRLHEDVDGSPQDGDKEGSHDTDAKDEQHHEEQEEGCLVSHLESPICVAASHEMNSASFTLSR